ncbi:MAG: hypothetical protein EZS28_038834, partial [Streblomastix strix]
NIINRFPDQTAKMAKELDKYKLNLQLGISEEQEKAKYTWHVSREILTVKLEEDDDDEDKCRFIPKDKANEWNTFDTMDAESQWRINSGWNASGDL